MKHLFCLTLFFVLGYNTSLEAVQFGLQTGFTDYGSVLRLSHIPYYGFDVHIPTTPQTDLMVTFETSLGQTPVEDARFISISNNKPLYEAYSFSYTALGLGGHYFLTKNAKGPFLHLVPKAILFETDKVSILGMSLEMGAGFTHRLGYILVRPRVGIHFHTLFLQKLNGKYHDFDSNRTSVSYQTGIQFTYSPSRKPTDK